MITIYGFNNGGSREWYEAVALGEDGICVGNHICSHEAYMPHDLGMDGRSNWKHENYDKQYGAGNWKTEFVPSDKIATHEGLQAVLKLAREKVERKEPIVACETAGATVVLEDTETNEKQEIRRGGAMDSLKAEEGKMIAESGEPS